MIRRQRFRTRVTKPDLVAAALIYPVSMVTGLNTGEGFVLTGNQFANVSQDLIRVNDSSNALRFRIGIVGGLYTIGRDVRAYNPAGTAYVALNGRSTIGCLELPDGSSAQGLKVWGGRGAPSASTVGAATAGDYYLRRADLAPVTIVACSYTTVTTQTSLSVGSGSLTSNTVGVVNGTPQAGDLLIFAVASTETTVTATIGADAAKTADLAPTDGTRVVRMFSQVLQPGDISSNVVLCTPSAHSTGTGRRLFAYILRHPAGFTTIGGAGVNQHSCPLVGSASDTASGATFTLTASAATTRAAVEVAVNYASASNSTTYRFDGGSTGSLVNDLPAASSAATAAARPGAGVNTSGAVGSSIGLTASVLLASAGATHTSALGVWQAAADAADTTAPLWYVCTASGTPGTWSSLL